MSETDQPPLATIRRRRGVVRASITRLATKLGELEAAHEPSALNLDHRMSQKIDALDSEFRTHHYTIVDAIPDDDDETPSREQEVLDQHDDDVGDLAVRVERLIAACSSASDSGAKKIASRRLSHLKRNLSSLNEAVFAMEGSAETPLLKQYQEQLTDFKQELADVRHELLTLGLDEHDELVATVTDLDKQLFDCSLQVKKLLYSPTTTVAPLRDSTDRRGVKLPKLDVPSFDGSLLNWQTFWEQFRIAVHDQSSISDAEKLVYLRNSLKDGCAKSVIEGLSRSGEHYNEAVECLQSRYDRPRLIHQTHVKKIVEFPPLKEG